MEKRNYLKIGTLEHFYLYFSDQKSNDACATALGQAEHLS